MRSDRSEPRCVDTRTCRSLGQFLRIVDRSPGRRANVFVPADSQHYARCFEIAKTANAADWKNDPGGRAGIWIAYDLFYGAFSGPKMKTWKSPSDDALFEVYGKIAAVE